MWLLIPILLLLIAVFLVTSLFAGIFGLIGVAWPWLLIGLGVWMFWHEDGRHRRQRRGRAAVVQIRSKLTRRSRSAVAAAAAPKSGGGHVYGTAAHASDGAADRRPGQSRTDRPQGGHAARLRRPVSAVFSGPVPGPADGERLSTTNHQCLSGHAQPDRRQALEPGRQDGPPGAQVAASTCWMPSSTTLPRISQRCRTPIGCLPIGAS